MTNWIAAALASLMLALSAHAADVPRADVFVAKVAGANLFEIESSKLAVTKTRSDVVRAYAEKMIADHTAGAGNLKEAVTDAKIKAPPDRLDAKHRAIYEDLKKKDGEAFDKAYLEAQRKAHLEAVELFQTYANAGDNARLKKFAGEMLPMLRTHLELVTRMH